MNAILSTKTRKGWNCGVRGFLTHPESAGQQEPPPQAILDAAFLVMFTIGTQVWDLKATAHLVSFTILPEETDMEAVEYRA